MLSYITEWWSQHMPHWGPLRAQKMNANTCGLPQSRARLIMASESNIFQDIAGIPSVPRVLPKVSLEIFFGIRGLLKSGADLHSQAADGDPVNESCFQERGPG